MWRAVRCVTSYVDSGLAAAAAVPLSLVRRVNRQRASQDVTYVTIECRRRNGAPLDLDDLLAMRDIVDRVGWHPWWEQFCHAAQQHPATQAARNVQFAWQRLARGWDDRSVWSLDTHLARTLSAQLTHLAETTHTWPGTPEYPTPETWDQALRNNADVLRVYADNAFTEPDGPLLEQQYRAAQDAIRWVADNFGHLWD